jgi:hypothetical protein
MDQSDEDRMKGRLWAEELIEDLGGESPDYCQGFLRAIKAALEQEQKEIDLKAMSDEESKRFGNQIIEFGKYRGKRYDDVPLDYWQWLADENNKIQRYLRSQRIKKELAEQ